MSQKQPSPSYSGDSLVNKKRTSSACDNIALMFYLLEWLPLDTLWQVVGNPVLEIFMKFQPFFDKYEPNTKCFLACLSLIVRGLNQDQINVIFCTMILNWYSIAEKADKIHSSKI